MAQRNTSNAPTSKRSKHIPAPVGTNNNDDDEQDDDYRVPAEEVIRRLRAREEPIRLFGETDKQRIRRLKILEAKEERSDGQRNEFKKVLEATDQRANMEYLKKQAGLVTDDDLEKVKRREAEGDVDTTPISLELLQKDPDRNYTLVGIYFRRLLYEWEGDLNASSDDEKRTPIWKDRMAKVQQTQLYMKPFLKQLKKRTILPDVMGRVSEIVQFMQQREYVRANEAYLQLAIGNAPWPIGVTMVGIHERSAREKIFASQVAHVLNDESQRKWIQSIKRLMKFCQEKRPPDDLGKAVG
ncbi:Prp18 domain-containing protein [Cladochytrium replicatum]|nr:Prp18 domain-containing protein [Cladochytrium replicatum]